MSKDYYKEVVLILKPKTPVNPEDKPKQVKGLKSQDGALVDAESMKWIKLEYIERIVE